MEKQVLMPKYMKGKKPIKKRKPSKPIDGINHRLLREQELAKEVVEVVEVEDNSAPTRAELETMATELNIKFDGRTTDKRLSDKIDQALGANDVVD
jgi:hypothetical protein